MAMLQEGGNSENPSNLLSSQQLSYIAGLLDHACASTRLCCVVCEHRSSLSAHTFPRILSYKHVGVDAWDNGGYFLNVSYIYILWDKRGDRGTNICDVMFCRTPGVGTILLGNRRYTQN